MRVVDVDSHFEPRGFAPGEHPLEELRDKLPSQVDVIIANLAGDLYDALPVERRPAPESLLPQFAPYMGSSPQQIDELIASQPVQPGAADADERVEWMDRVGIDFALVNPGGAYSGSVASCHQFFEDPVDRHRAIVLCNDYLADQLSAYPSRMSPVTILDFNDLDWSITELERMRALGSRAYFVWAAPFEGRSPAHPAVDRFWRTSTDLGMVALLHIGNTPANFAGGWADAGWDEPSGAGAGGFLRFANSQRTQSAQTFLAALVFGGTLARNPNLTVVLSELWASWLPWFLSRIEMLGDANGALGEWTHELSPGEMLRAHLKGSPLPGLHDDGMRVIHEIPDMLVFSSDFPHNEGNAEPMAVYGDALDALDPDTRAAFLGGTMLDVFARMGDELPV
ncbi:MAG: amidohydrolase family protein [Acidimicrobiia bacterium]